MESVMSGDGTVGGLGLDGAIRALEHGGHETKGSVTLSDNV